MLRTIPHLHKIYFLDSSADPLLDEHFRRSLGANYESLFKKKSSSSTASDSESSSTESTPPKVPQMPPKNQDSPKDSSPKTNDANNKGDNNDKATSDDNDSKDDATQVADPVKAFRKDMEMEGFSGKELFSCTVWKYNMLLIRFYVK